MIGVEAWICVTIYSRSLWIRNRLRHACEDAAAVIVCQIADASAALMVLYWGKGFPWLMVELREI